MEPHELAEERSLAVHRRVAERLRDDPGPQAPAALFVSVAATFARAH